MPLSYYHHLFLSEAGRLETRKVSGGGVGVSGGGVGVSGGGGPGLMAVRGPAIPSCAPALYYPHGKGISLSYGWRLTFLDDFSAVSVATRSRRGAIPIIGLLLLFKSIAIHFHGYIILKGVAAFFLCVFVCAEKVWWKRW